MAQKDGHGEGGLLPNMTAERSSSTRGLVGCAAHVTQGPSDELTSRATNAETCVHAAREACMEPHEVVSWPQSALRLSRSRDFAWYGGDG